MLLPNFSFCCCVFDSFRFYINSRANETTTSPRLRQHNLCTLYLVGFLLLYFHSVPGYLLYFLFLRLTRLDTSRTKDHATTITYNVYRYIKQALTCTNTFCCCWVIFGFSLMSARTMKTTRILIGTSSLVSFRFFFFRSDYIPYTVYFCSFFSRGNEWRSTQKSVRHAIFNMSEKFSVSKCTGAGGRVGGRSSDQSIDHCGASCIEDHHW